MDVDAFFGFTLQIMGEMSPCERRALRLIHVCAWKDDVKAIAVR